MYKLLHLSTIHPHKKTALKTTK